MKRLLIFMYGVASYALSLVVFVYAAGFLGNLWVPKSIDSARDVPLASALLVNLALLGLFAVQHSVMARPSFKRWWTRIVPPAAERSTYMLFSNLCLIALFYWWQPMGGVIWELQSAAAINVMYAVYFAGWILLLFTTFLINHFDLFGLRQVCLQLLGKPYTPVSFRSPWLYRQVRHPLYVGWLMIFWAAPTMTMAHLLFAAITTTYILVAIQFEERDLCAEHPGYVEYKKQVPMLIPFMKRAARGARPLAGKTADKAA